MSPGEPLVTTGRPPPGNPRRAWRPGDARFAARGASSSTNDVTRVAVDRWRSWPRRIPRFTWMCVKFIPWS